MPMISDTVGISSIHGGEDVNVAVTQMADGADAESEQVAARIQEERPSRSR